MLGRHTDHRQKRIIRIIGVAVVVGLIAWIVWPSGHSQAPAKGVYTPVSGTQTTIPSNGAGPVTTTTNGATVNSTKPQVSGGNPSYSNVAVPPVTTTIPVVTGAPDTTTTMPSVPAGATVDYGAAVDPRFVQSPTNPLRVTYSFSASASIVEDGEFVPVASLPPGTLKLFSEVGLICSMNVGGTVTSGTCATTYASFGSHNVVANYIVNGSTFVSVILADDVEPFGTTTVAGIAGGGSLGGLVFFASVTDANGNPVTTGAVSMTIADVTQGWNYVVGGTLNPDGAHINDFGCLVIENLPKVGEYSGCGLSQGFVVTPADGDTLTETVAYTGTGDWSSSSSTQDTYAMP